MPYKKEQIELVYAYLNYDLSRKELAKELDCNSGAIPHRILSILRRGVVQGKVVLTK